MTDFPPTGGPPGESDLPFLEPHLLPARRKHEVALVRPPDVLAASIDQFELEIVGRSFAAHREAETIVRRQIEAHGAAGDRVAAPLHEMEIEAAGAPVATRPGAGRELDPAR